MQGHHISHKMFPWNGPFPCLAHLWIHPSSLLLHALAMPMDTTLHMRCSLGMAHSHVWPTFGFILHPYYSMLWQMPMDTTLHTRCSLGMAHSHVWPTFGFILCPYYSLLWQCPCPCGPYPPTMIMVISKHVITRRWQMGTYFITYYARHPTSLPQKVLPSPLLA